MKTLINEADYQIYPQRFKPVNNEVIYQIYPLTFNYAKGSKSDPYKGAYGNLKGITAFLCLFGVIFFLLLNVAKWLYWVLLRIALLLPFLFCLRFLFFLILFFRQGVVLFFVLFVLICFGG